MIEPKIADIREALDAQDFPTVVFFNRLEGRPHTHDFARSTKAEVRDALWMLTRQWQTGEYRGNDAGSIFFAKVHFDTKYLTKLEVSAQDTQPFNVNIPLEAQVERRSLPSAVGSQDVALDLRLLMGRYWLKLIAGTGLEQYFIDYYSIRMPDDRDVGVCAHAEAWQRVAAAAHRAMDGLKLYRHLKAEATNHAYDDMDLTPTQEATIETFEQPFVAWFEKLLYQPDDQEQSAWVPEYLEYQFCVAGPKNGGETVFAADEYYHGRLDWYSLDVDAGRQRLPDIDTALAPEPLEPKTLTFVPTQVTFDGMPNTRWWSFEDERVNFGDIKPGTKDLATLLLIEFGLLYANDWLLFPLTLPVGTVTRIDGLAVTNVFGERIWIEPADRGPGHDWERCSMFTLSTKGDEEREEKAFLLLPTVPKLLESKPLEEIVLIRDEMANIVWGIETTVPMVDGRSKSGHEAALETRSYFQRLLDQDLNLDPDLVKVEAEPVAAIRYKVMVNPVPENWIPYIPVHMTNDNRQVQLQRAALPRILDNDPAPPKRIRPRTVLMQECQFIHEEEVPRAGICITQSYQRTRWNDGRAFTWLGVRKQTGRGEGASNLAFDQILLTSKITGNDNT